MMKQFSVLLTSLIALKSVLAQTPVQAQCTVLGGTYAHGSCFWQRPDGSFSWTAVDADSTKHCADMGSGLKGHAAFVLHNDMETTVLGEADTADKNLIGLHRTALGAGPPYTDNWCWKESFDDPPTTCHAAPIESLPTWVGVEPDDAGATAYGMYSLTDTDISDWTPATAGDMICQFEDRNYKKEFRTKIEYRNRRMMNGSSLIISEITPVPHHVRCVEECLNARICTSFSYGNQTCELYYPDLQGHGDLREAPGWQWFERIW